MAEPGSYAEALVEAQRLLRTGRMADPGEHFPYRHDAVSAVVAGNPPMGPDGPDDDRVRAEDYMSQDIADASAAYIAAQQAYLADPGDSTRAEYVEMRRVLQEARVRHREHRVSPVVVGIRARRAGE